VEDGMNLQEFAESIVNDPRYRETVRARAFDGTLPPDVELMLLEMADQRWPLAADRPLQSRTLALVRSEAQP
jgi:hypothetical protein